MTRTVFWYTGMVTWSLVGLACATIVAVELHDRSKRSRNG
jgi:hypothetical protein